MLVAGVLKRSEPRLGSSVIGEVRSLVAVPTELSRLKHGAVYTSFVQSLLRPAQHFSQGMACQSRALLGLVECVVLLSDPQKKSLPSTRVLFESHSLDSKFTRFILLVS